VSSTDALVEFFRREVRGEAESAFARLRTIPSTRVRATLMAQEEFQGDERDLFLEVCALTGASWYAFVSGVPPPPRNEHPLFQSWLSAVTCQTGLEMISIPGARAIRAQHKIDRRLGKEPHFSEEAFAHAESLDGATAPELRAAIKGLLSGFGLSRVENRGGGNYWYHCRHGANAFILAADYGGRSQLRYELKLPGLEPVDHRNRFIFEAAVGAGDGDWNIIERKDLERAMRALAMGIDCCLDLPNRLRQFTG
jgi:hypothetical protein